MQLKPETVGLGLRREMLTELEDGLPQEVDFWEVAPENWLPLGPKYNARLKQLTDKHPFVTHGLSLSIGSPDPLDVDLVDAIRGFVEQHQIAYYSEHLSYCSANGHMYDLMPIPFTQAAVDYVVERVQRVQERLGFPLVLENVSYYAAPGQEMSELDFTLEVLSRSGAKLLLDVNNIYVNSINHGYDPLAFLAALPTNKIAYGHIAGHYNEADDLIVDTHGADVIEPVWQLLQKAYEYHGVFPTLLERDFNIPPIAMLLKEVARIKDIQRKVSAETADRALG